MSMKYGFGAAIVAAIVAGSVGAAVAQQAETVTVPVKKVAKGYAARTSAGQRTRTLTVAAPAQAQPGITSPFGLVTAPIGFAGNIIQAPLNGLSQAFGFGPAIVASRPLPIVARYADAGPVTDSVNQGWAQPVPLAANGPIYKLEEVKNTGTVSPFTLIAAPITAATTLAATPFNVAGSVLGAPPAPPPVF